MKLTKQQAARFLLEYQHLLPPRRAGGKAGALAYVRKVGCIQFDPLDVVGYNPSLVLQARVKGYGHGMLEELLYADRLLVDGFDKQLSIWPVEDWPSFSRNRCEAGQWYGRCQSGFADTLEHVRAAVRERGALCSADLEAREKVNWPWGPTNAVRAALESLYFTGELVIHHKAGARKYYDLSARHIPPDILEAPDPHPEDERYLRWRVHRRVGSVGLLWDRGGDAWLGIGGMKAARRAAAVAALAAAGDLTPVEVEGVPWPFYVRSLDVGELEQSLALPDAAPAMAFLAPLDNLLWDRKMAEALFGFAYRWEVYTPAPQRKYGYYVLPVLYGDRFVARVEPKFNKKAKSLELLQWWWEDGVRPDGGMKKAFRACVRAFMGYLGAKEIVYSEEYRGPRL